jgi:hypothetical protein
MTGERLAQAKADGSPWFEFWLMLEPIWRASEENHLPPKVEQGKVYSVRCEGFTQE